jgi:hypothetical protein
VLQLTAQLGDHQTVKTMIKPANAAARRVPLRHGYCGAWMAR